MEKPKLQDFVSAFKKFVWTCTVPQTSLGNLLSIITPSFCTYSLSVSESALSGSNINLLKLGILSQIWFNTLTNKEALFTVKRQA